LNSSCCRRSSRVVVGVFASFLGLSTVGARDAHAQLATHFVNPLEGGWGSRCSGRVDTRTANCITQGFGRASDNTTPALQQDWWVSRRSGYHLAFDIFVPYTPEQQSIRPPFSVTALASLKKVYAPANGVIKMARETTGPDGYWVVIEHELPRDDPDGPFVCSVFFHMVRPSQGGPRLAVGTRVNVGDTIGYVSPLASDHSRSVPHQHFGIRKGRYAGDPWVLNPITNLWYYPGYTTSNPPVGPEDESHAEVINEWFNPQDFLVRHAVPANRPPTGSLDGVNGSNQIFGWASDPDNSDVAIDVHLYIDKNAGESGAAPILVRANQFRADVGSHAFNWDIPSNFKDGQTHTVWAWGIDLADPVNNNGPLPGSPKTFNISPAPTAPIARDDFYTVIQGTTLTVPAPGLLANDTYPSGSTIEFLPPFPPAGLTNVFPYDGGFILDMSANPTFVGLITMNYVVHSNAGDSNVAIVTVTVTDGAPSQKGRIAFTSHRDGNAEIYTMEPDGTDVIRMTTDAATDFTPEWSPDGKSIAFLCGFDTADTTPGVCLMNSDGGGLRRLTNDDIRVGTGKLTWFPDGSTISFQAHEFLAGPSAIYTINVDSSELSRLSIFASDDFEPDWSPDGTKVVFTSLRDGDSEIYVMNADGTDAINLSADATTHDYQPTWSPDGSRIAFTSLPTSGGPVVISVVNADGSEKVALTPVPGNNSQPSWRSDGTQIAFTRYTNEGSTEIFVMHSDGSEPANLTNNSAWDDGPSWQPVSLRPPTDDFNDDSLDIRLWDVVISPSGVGTITEVNQRLEMFRLTTGVAYQGLQNKCTVTGDFDVQVDFTLASWTPQNFNTVRLAAMDLPGPFGIAGVYRNSYNNENYQLRTEAGVVAEVSTTDSGGKLRLKRTGSIIEGFYWDGAQFIRIGSSEGSSESTRFLIDFTAPSDTSPSGLEVTFDNFRINAGAFACP
jgi:hypothetical protein